MTSAQLVMFLAFLVVVAGVWWTLFFALPLMARAKFQYRVTVLRDECLDAVFDGRLPRSEPVVAFLDIANAMATQPEFFTLARAFAAHMAMAELDCRIGEDDRRDYSALALPHRELLEKFDDELNKAFTERLIYGSSFGWLLVVAPRIYRLFRRSGRHPAASAKTFPRDLAREYETISERVPRKGRELVGLSR